MSEPIQLPVTASCPCTRSPDVGTLGRCPLTDVRRRRGDVLFSEGEPAASVWYVKRGCVVLTRQHEGGATPYAIRRAGSFVGMEALVSSTYLHTARVTSATVLGQGSQDLVREWLAHGPSARMVLEEVLRAECADRPRAATTDGTAAQRAARWILCESGRGPLAHVPRCFAAGLLGMAPETFSRALVQLADAGAIRVTRTSLDVRDAGRLRELAEGTDAAMLDVEAAAVSPPAS